jgi:hypothetical protein
MSRPKTIALVGLCLFLGVTDAVAQDQPVVHIGAGSQSCGIWLASRDGAKSSVASARNENALREGMMLSWIQGFVTGAVVNAPLDAELRNRATLSIPDAPSVEAFLDKYCRQEPLELIGAGGIALYKELFDRLTK